MHLVTTDPFFLSAVTMRTPVGRSLIADMVRECTGESCFCRFMLLNSALEFVSTSTIALSESQRRLWVIFLESEDVLNFGIGAVPER